MLARGALVGCACVQRLLYELRARGGAAPIIQQLHGVCTQKSTQAPHTRASPHGRAERMVQVHVVLSTCVEQGRTSVCAHAGVQPTRWGVRRALHPSCARVQSFSSKALCCSPSTET